MKTTTLLCVWCMSMCIMLFTSCQEKRTEKPVISDSPLKDSAIVADHESNNTEMRAYDTLPTYTDSTYSAYQKLQGTWISEKDKYYSLTFNENSFIENSGNKSDTSTYKLFQHCPHSASIAADVTGTFVGFQSEQTGEPSCLFEIVSVTQKTLSIMYVDNSRVVVLNRAGK